MAKNINNGNFKDNYNKANYDEVCLAQEWDDTWMSKKISKFSKRFRDGKNNIQNLTKLY